MEQIKNKKHLFQKGESGNPNGRPKGTFSLVEIIRRKLQEVPPEYKNDKKTYAELLVTNIFNKGIVDGDHPTQKLIINYVDGLPKASVDHTTNGENLPASINLNFS